MSYQLAELERKYDALQKRADILEQAARETLETCGHLADGENCTLIVLKRAVREIDSLNAQADDVQADDKLHARPTAETMRRWIERVQKDVTGATGIPWQVIAEGIDRTPENEAAERAIDSLHAQADVDISGAAGSVKK